MTGNRFLVIRENKTTIIIYNCCYNVTNVITTIADYSDSDGTSDRRPRLTINNDIGKGLRVERKSTHETCEDRFVNRSNEHLLADQYNNNFEIR